MKTKTYNVYKFDELTDEQKQKAIENLRDINVDYDWSSEYQESMRAFESDFPVKITDWSIDYGHSYVRFDFTDDEHAEISGDKLRKHLLNHYFTSLWTGKYYGRLVNTFPKWGKISSQ